MNNKGFTLIEIVAVVTIITILSLVAVPVVSRIISNGKKDTFVENARREIEVAKSLILNGDLAVSKHYIAAEKPSKCKVPPIGYYTIIPESVINGSSEKDESSFGYNMKLSYVVIVNVSNNGVGTGSSDNLVYFYGGVDAGNNGIDSFIAEDALKRGSVKVGNGVSSNLSITSLSKKTFNYRGSSANYKFYQTCKSK